MSPPPRPMFSIAGGQGCGALRRPQHRGVPLHLGRFNSGGGGRPGGEPPLLARALPPRPGTRHPADAVAPPDGGATARPLTQAPVARRDARLIRRRQSCCQVRARAFFIFSEKGRDPFVWCRGRACSRPSPRRSSRRPCRAAAGIWSLEGALADPHGPIPSFARDLLGQRPRSRDASASAGRHGSPARSRAPARH